MGLAEHKDDMVLTKTWTCVAIKAHYKLTDVNYCGA
jgi:hypothetical protein